MVESSPLRGIFTALATPFDTDGNLDRKAYENLIDHQIIGGVQGLVPVGTTGESPSLSIDEHKRAIDLCIEYTAGRLPVIAGAGANATEEAINLARFAQKAGAQATLQVTPYYNKPTQEGLYSHFCEIANRVDLPIMLYNVPARTSVNLEIETIIRLVENCPSIISLKDALPQDLTRVSHLMRIGLRKNFTILSGEDASLCAFLAMGGEGCVSVTSNITPNAMVALYEAFNSGDLVKMAAIRNSILPLWQALFCETSPAPVKYALYRQGIFATSKTRLPLLEATSYAQKRVTQALKEVTQIGNEFSSKDYKKRR